MILSKITSDISKHGTVLLNKKYFEFSIIIN